MPTRLKYIEDSLGNFHAGDKSSEAHHNTDIRIKLIIFGETL
jgi:hypothetical protein